MDPLPDDWRLARLGDSEIAEIRGSKKFPNYENVAFIPMEYIPDSGTYAKYEVRPRSQIKSFTYCEKGDLLLAKITPSLENGKQGIVPDNVPNGFALATTEVFPISCKRMNSLFVFYVLKHSCFRNKIISSMTGTTGRQRATKESVEKLFIPFPPLFEQVKIAEILSTVDQAIEKVGEAIEKTERLKKGLMQELLTKGIGHKEFKITEIGTIPIRWEVAKLSQVGKIVTGTTPSTNVDIFWGEGFPFVTPSDFSSNKYVLKTERNVTEYGVKKAKIIPKDSIMVSCIGSIGEIAMSSGECLTNQQINSIICDKENNPHYIYYAMVFSKRRLKRWAGITTNPIVKKSLFELFPLPLPPLPEQQKIAEILSSVDKRIETLRKRKERLEKVKRGLMEDLLTGKKRVKLED